MGSRVQLAQQIINDANQEIVETKADFNHLAGRINEAIDRMVAAQRESNSCADNDGWRDACEANQVLNDGYGRLSDRYAYLFS